MEEPEKGSIKVFLLGSGEMAQQLRALVALAEDPGSGLSTHPHGALQLPVILLPGDPIAFSDFTGLLHT